MSLQSILKSSSSLADAKNHPDFEKELEKEFKKAHKKKPSKSPVLSWANVRSFKKNCSHKNMFVQNKRAYLFHTCVSISFPLDLPDGRYDFDKFIDVENGDFIDFVSKNKDQLDRRGDDDGSIEDRYDMDVKHSFKVSERDLKIHKNVIEQVDKHRDYINCLYMDLVRKSLVSTNGKVLYISNLDFEESREFDDVRVSPDFVQTIFKIGEPNKISVSENTTIAEYDGIVVRENIEKNAAKYAPYTKIFPEINEEFETDISDFKKYLKKDILFGFHYDGSVSVYDTKRKQFIINDDRSPAIWVSAVGLKQYDKRKMIVGFNPAKPDAVLINGEFIMAVADAPYK